MERASLDEQVMNDGLVDGQIAANGTDNGDGGADSSDR